MATIDESRRAHLERVMERRRREGRSSASRSSTVDNGLMKLGNVVPATFPPAEPNTPGRQYAGYPPVQHPSSPAPYASAHSALYPTDAGNPDTEQQIERQRRELMELRGETQRQLEIQKAIAAQSENQLLWQQRQLEQLGGGGGGASSVEDRLREREQRLAQDEARLSAAAAERENEIARRLKTRESMVNIATTPASVGLSEQAPRTAGNAYRVMHTPPPPDRAVGPVPAGAGAADTQALQNRVAQLEARMEAASASASVARHHASPSPARASLQPAYDPYDVPVNRPTPSVTASHYFDQSSFTKPAYIRSSTTHRTTPAEGPVFSSSPPRRDSRYDNSRGAYGANAPPPYRSSSNPPPQGAGGGYSHMSTPWIGPEYDGRPSNDSPPRSNYSRNPLNKTVADPVFDYQNTTEREDAYQPRYAAPREQSMRGSPPRDHSAASRPAGILMDNRQSQMQMQMQMQPSRQNQVMPAGMGGYSGYGQPPPQFIHRPQVNQQMHRDNILHDMKAGDWFIKWTKNDRPHLRWFWLNHKKMLLYWSNTQSASVLMSNNIRLEEVVSIEAEQLTEESPGDPGHPQIYYLMTIVTFKRPLQIACQPREKFNKWFEGLSLLTKEFRKVNEVAYSQALNPALSGIISRPSVTTAINRSAAMSAAD
ncbi:hypothetical protein DIPPA_05214 [Diplonema papillatum]|nr:hypothetical protein DIPPA_05214 [Diplonema papillatum]